MNNKSTIETAKPHPITKRDWRLVAKKQLERSNISTKNELGYGPYVSILYHLALQIGINDYNDAKRNLLQPEISKFIQANRGMKHQADILWYVASLLFDYNDMRYTEPFNGTILSCGSCGATAFYNEISNRYECCMCEASAEAGENRMPRATPVVAEMRQERVRLHRKLDSMCMTKSERFKFYSHISYKLKIPLEHTHIGDACTKEDVDKWNLAIDSIKAFLERNTI